MLLFLIKTKYAAIFKVEKLLLNQEVKTETKKNNEERKKQKKTTAPALRKYEFSEHCVKCGGGYPSIT